MHEYTSPSIRTPAQKRRRVYGRDVAVGGDADLPDSAPPLEVAAVLALPAHASVSGCALVLRSEAAIDRTGAPYLLLTLRGADGARIEARW